MGNYEELKTAIADVIKPNGNQEITGAIMQNVLQTIVSTIGANATFAGIATPTTNPGTPDANVFYLAIEPGTYVNFGGIEVVEDKCIILSNESGAWEKKETGIATTISLEKERDNILAIKAGVFAPYFSDGVTFGLDDDKRINLLKSALVHLSFKEPLKTKRIAIFSLQNTELNTILYIADCEGMGDDEVIPIEKVFAWLNVEKVGTLIVGDIRSMLNAGEIIGTAVIDGYKLKQLTQGITSSMPTTYGNSAISRYDIDTENIYGELVKAQWKLSPMLNLDWGIRFKGNEDSYIAPLNNIVLNKSGDSIEILFGEIETTEQLKGGYSFTKGLSSLFRGIAVTNRLFAVRTDNGTWLAQDKPFSSNSKLKIEYTDSDVIISVNDAPVVTYAGLLPITIVSFGNGTANEYWKGVVKKIIYNGNEMVWHESFNKGTDINLYRSSGFLTDEQVENTIYPELFAQKIATTLYLYKRLKANQYIEYPLNYRQAAYKADTYPSYFGNWGIGKLALCTFDGNTMTRVAYLFYNAEAEMAIKVDDAKGGKNYVGGAMHGFENIKTDEKGNRNIRILVNEQNVGEADTFDLREISSAHIIQQTELTQAYSNTNPFANVVKEWIFDKTGLQITTEMDIIRVLDIAQAQFGMMGVYRHWEGKSANNYLTSQAVKSNKPFITYNIEDNWEADSELDKKDAECSKITVYGERGIGFSLHIVESTIKSNGGMFVTTNGGNPYNKIYFDLTGIYTPSVSEKLSATQKWIIE